VFSRIFFVVFFLISVAGAEPVPVFLKAESLKIRDEGPSPSVGYRIVTYPFNRVLDFADMLSFQFGFGFGLHGNVHVTRMAQAGAGGYAVSKLGFDGRRIGLCNDSKAETSVLAASAEYYKRQNAFGTFKDYTGEQRPWLYREHRDYWGIGQEMTLFIVNAGWEAHIKEAPDFLLGFLGVDYMHDDFPKPWSGHRRPKLAPADAARIKKVILCPSRVVHDSKTRMATDKDVGAYFYRYPREAAAGRMGEFFGSDNDREVSDQYTGLLRAQKVDLYRTLLEDAERAVLVDLGWEVVDVDQILAYFEKHAVVMTHRGQKIRRLPNYRKMAEYFGADAVLDLRVWECGIWRQTLADKGVLKMDVEAKLIGYPQNEVLFDARVVSTKDAEAGQPLLSFAAHDGRTLAREVREGCDVISAKIKDLLIEEK
jgi:hypothetical protein